ncbi:Glu-tRNA(Gln) amidotransferase subunit GatD [Candidatus Parvarchaeota archaeon]|nr:Glu-tRNA(Gln) amidotransferase subunit GatD [Candidatus Parvarchaeota archaeon]
MAKKNVKKTGSFSKGDILKFEFDGMELSGEFIKKGDDLLIIKLSSGYDIAVPEKSFRLLKTIKSAQKTTEKIVPEKSEKEPDITIITTGGTISSKIDYETGGVSPTVSSDYYFDLAPKMSEYGKVAIKPIMSILSENMQPSDWIKIASEAKKAIDQGSKGVIITMGTDTMHYAASALSFMLNPLSVPVVFTGAQRSVDRGSSDASTNLLLSAITASKWDGGEVVICMHAGLNDDRNFILRGNKARKMHTERRDAFRPINTKPLAEVYLDGSIKKAQPYRIKSNETSLDTKLEENVKLIISYPSMGGDIINYYIKKGVKGLVIAATGFGNLPLQDKSVYEAITLANKKNIPIVITSQTIYGATNEFVYNTLRELSRFENIIYVGDMTTEAAFSKLMFVLGHTKKIGEVREMMLKNMAGELSVRNEVDSFLL